MNTHKPILCLDFDGVLHSYTSGWQGADVISDPPVEGAMGFIKDAVQHFKVCVYSSRSHQSGGIKAMMRWLHNHLVEAHGVEWTEINAPSIIFPAYKPSAMITIDDRAITFTGAWPDVDVLLKFKPWNKQ